MGLHYTHSAPGKHFEVTFLGRKRPQIAAKFRDGYIHKQQYEHSIPVSWVTNKWVVEVDNNGEVGKE